jgi:HD-GYP domain-containing protein (c-di-GMP phosphodiesterase class II)
MVNGEGYPRRQFQRGVHSASKLVHVCDVYDALRTNRPYRPAWDSEKVLSHIEKGAGPDFDLESATAFITMMRNWEPRLAVVDDQTTFTLGGALQQTSGAAPAAAPPQTGESK